MRFVAGTGFRKGFVLRPFLAPRGARPSVPVRIPFVVGITQQGRVAVSREGDAGADFGVAADGRLGRELGLLTPGPARALDSPGRAEVAATTQQWVVARSADQRGVAVGGE